MDVGTLAMVATSRYYLVSNNILIIHILFILPILLLDHAIRQIIVLIKILLLVHHLILMNVESQIIQIAFLKSVFQLFFLSGSVKRFRGRVGSGNVFAACMKSKTASETFVCHKRKLAKTRTHHIKIISAREQRRGSVAQR